MYIAAPSLPQQPQEVGKPSIRLHLFWRKPFLREGQGTIVILPREVVLDQRLHTPPLGFQIPRDRHLDGPLLPLDLQVVPLIDTQIGVQDSLYLVPALNHLEDLTHGSPPGNADVSGSKWQLTILPLQLRHIRFKFD